MAVRYVYFLAVVGFVQCNLNCEDIKKVIDGHNKRRLLIARGNVNGQPSARKMNMMVWDEQLAAKATEWASNNDFNHNPDQSIDSPKFRSTGENLYKFSTTASNINFDPEKALASWFDEHNDYTYKRLEYEDMLQSAPIGHYTQMVWSDTTHVGCGVSQSKKGRWTTLLFVCNYGPAGNCVSQYPYKSGTASENLQCSIGDCSRKYGNNCLKLT